MPLRTFGTTNLRVSRLGLGLAALGRPGYINLGHGQDLGGEYDPGRMQEHACEVLDAAWEAGVRYFDVARSYGRAEAFLKHWLQARGLAPADVVVGSKWGYVYTADWQVEAEHHEIKEHSAALLERQWLETQAQLGRYCKLYQIHSATLESGGLEDLDVLERLGSMREEGVHIGLSLSGPRQAETLERALDVLVDGVALFESVQATWNVLERSASAALQLAHDSGLGVIVKEALANGRLTERGEGAVRDVLTAQAARLGATPDALALAMVLEQPWADIVLSGAARVEHLQANLRASELVLDDEAREQLARLVEPPEAYWRTRGTLRWN